MCWQYSECARPRGSARNYRLTGAMVSLMIALGAGPANAADRIGGGSIVTSAESVERVEIVVNKSKTFTLARPFSTVTVGNGDYAEALPMSDRVLYVQGKKIGTTNISIFDTTARLVSVIDVAVVPEIQARVDVSRTLQQ